MLFLQVVFSVVWLGKGDVTKQGVFLFVCLGLVCLPVNSMPHNKEQVMSHGACPIIYLLEVENYTRIDIMDSFYLFPLSLSQLV